MESSKIMNWEVFEIENHVSRTQDLKLKYNVQNLDSCIQLILSLSISRHLYALKTYLCVQQHVNFSIFTQTMPAQLISRPAKKKFSHDPLSCKRLNQFKPVLMSESVDPQDDYGTHRFRIHPVLTEKNIALRKWLYQFDSFSIFTTIIH